MGFFFVVAQAALVFTAAEYEGKDACFTDPTLPSCKNADDFYPPETVEQDMDSLCSMMSWMSGCSVRNKCKSGDATGRFCAPWSLLADVCSTDWGESMDGMMGCTNYTALCRPNTAVEQCATDKGIPFLVPTAEAITDTLALCTEMPDMEQCKDCTGSSNLPSDCPDPLGTLSAVCLSMNMRGCEKWSSMCKSNPPGIQAFCGEEAPGECSGMMQMYFHNGFQDYVLFKDWVPCTAGRYNAAVLGVFLASTFAVLLKVLRFRMERRMSVRRRISSRETLRTDLLQDFEGRERREEEQEVRCSGPVEATIFPGSWDDLKENVVRSGFVGLTMTLDYSLMLVAMTFNYGLFFAVIAGAMCGALLFGHAGQREQRGKRVLPGGEVTQEHSFEDEAAGTAALEDRACCQNT